MSRFQMVQCDALYEGCEGEITLDDAEGWQLDEMSDLCPNCADIRADDAEFERNAKA